MSAMTIVTLSVTPDERIEVRHRRDLRNSYIELGPEYGEKITIAVREGNDIERAEFLDRLAAHLIDAAQSLRIEAEAVTA